MDRVNIAGSLGGHGSRESMYCLCQLGLWVMGVAQSVGAQSSWTLQPSWSGHLVTGWGGAYWDQGRYGVACRGGSGVQDFNKTNTINGQV